MKKTNEEPQIKELFKDENLCIQYAYKAKKQYETVYINSELYEEIFQRKFEWDEAVKEISNAFSITLDSGKSNGLVVGKAYSDRQLDPFGIALSGNKGSGRAYFYGNLFNIKGDKTKLATAPKSIYSNGKYALSAAIKETVLSNILAKDFVIPTFETLAILDTKEKFDFIEEYLDSNDEIKSESYHLPCCIEIRVNEENKLYRISNKLINNERYTLKELEELCEKLAIIEANKFCDRFLHGSWSVGNISTKGNLIDFDTASFVKGRFPQYSNTNKYKANYFGNELLGQKLMIESLLKNSNIENRDEVKKYLENLMEEKYLENLTIRFCDLIGLDYKSHYEKNKKDIDNLCEKFNKLSRMFLPNYYETKVTSEYGDVTNVFDFSNFFQKYLLKKELNKMNSILGMELLINNSEFIIYEKIGMIKEKIEDFFKEELVRENELDDLILDGMEFIQAYDEFFEKIKETEDLSNIVLKQYLINSDRNYLYGNDNIYGELSYLYDSKKIDSEALNKIINALIKTNKRNNFSNILGLKIYKDFLYYFIVSPNYYSVVIETFSHFKVDFAKVIINDEDFMVKHTDIDNMMITENIEFNKLEDILDDNIQFLINGKIYEKSEE